MLICLIQFVILLACIFIGARIGGIGLGVMGGVGLTILVFIFGLKPATAPIDVMLMIAAVVVAASALQASGGLDYLVHLAEKALRRNPKWITFVAPTISYLFTLGAGTGHVVYSILPVIAEVARDTGIRPERPMSISVVAGQQAITASPISAATVALLSLLTPLGVTLPQILLVCIPATFIGSMIGALAVSRMGKELPDDPEYKRLLDEGLATISPKKKEAYVPTSYSKIAVVLFLISVVLVVLLGAVDTLRPGWVINGTFTRMQMPAAIEIIMLTIGALIMLICKAKSDVIVSGSVFKAGMTAVLAIFGIAWMGDTFYQGNSALINSSVEGIVSTAPWLFAVALFILSILLYSQAATVTTLMPLGISLGITPALLVGMFPACNGYFFIPNYPTVVAAINFDPTGTTHIGKFVLNHSFMIPGLAATISSVAIGIALSMLVM